MITDVRTLRKNGQLALAYKFAHEKCAAFPQDVWAKRDLAWVCYDFMKLAFEKKDAAEFYRSFQEIIDVNLPSDDTMLGNSLSWLIGKWIESVLVPMDSASNKQKQLQQIVSQFVQFPKEVPSLAYSFFVSKVHKAAKNEPYYAELIGAIGFQFFEAKDYNNFTLENGKSIMSLAEQIYIAYAKSLLSNFERVKYAKNGEKEYLIRLIEWFLPQLSHICKIHPEYLYPPYFNGKLLLLLQRNEEAIQLLIPFVKVKSSDFWVWQILGEATSCKDAELALSCFSRALLCKSKPEMLVGLREEMAKMMLQLGFYNEARTELDFAAAIRIKKWGKVSKFILNESAQPWYQEASPAKNNENFYREHASHCEDVIYAKDYQLMLITFVNQSKGIANFILQNDNVGYFNYSKVLKNIQQDEVYVAIVNYSDQKPSQVVRIKKYEKDKLDTPFYKNISGKLIVNKDKGFAFVNNVFVRKDVVTTSGLKNNDEVEALAMRSYDRSKQKMSWQISKLKRLNK